jgi:hypothetical protein
MNQRTARIVVLALGVVGLGVIAFLARPRPRLVPDADVLLPTLAQRINDSAAIELASGASTLRLERTGDSWIVPDKTGLPARLDKIRPLLIGLAEMQATNPKTTNPDMYHRIGVAEPSPLTEGTRVTVYTDANETLGSVIVGHATKEGAAELRYVRLPDEPQSWLSPAKIEVLTDPLHWMDRALTRIDGAQVQSMYVTHPDGDELGLSRADSAQTNFDVAPIPAGSKLRSPGIADPMTRALTNLNFDDVRKAAGDLQGVPTEIVVTTFDGLVITIQIYDMAGQKWAHLAAHSASVDLQPEQLAGLAARFEDREFLLPSWAATNLSRRMSELVEPLPQVQPAEDDGAPRGPVLDPQDG